MKKFIIMLFIVGIAFACVWYLRSIRGDGIIKSEDRSIIGFSKITVAGTYNVKWSHGKPALSISTDQNLLQHIRTLVGGNALQIDSKENLIATKGITFILSSESLADVQLTGANTFTAEELSGPDLKLNSTGASTITVNGSVIKLTVNLTGASTLHAKALQAETCTLSITGASHADLTVTDNLNASIAGAGTVKYSGKPKSVEQHVTGAGSIKPQP